MQFQSSSKTTAALSFGRAFKTAVLTASLAFALSSAQAGTLILNTFTDDAGSGIALPGTGTTGVYTHAIDFNSDDGGATINGVVFTPGTRTGTNYTLTGADGGNFQNYSPSGLASGGVADLVDDFHHRNGSFPIGSTQTLTLSGLLPNTEYRAHIFIAGFSGRLQTFSANDGGTTTTVPDQDRGVSTGAGTYVYTYTTGAEQTSVALSFSNQQANDGFHWYGFANHTVIPEPSSLSLLGLGALGLLARRRRRK